MARLNKLNLAIAPLQGAEYAVDAVSRITKNLSDAPRMEALDYEVANGSAHDGSRECGRKGMLTRPLLRERVAAALCSNLVRAAALRTRQ